MRHKFAITKCHVCKAWLVCYEGGVQGFDSWQGAFNYADALSMRPRPEYAAELKKRQAQGGHDEVHA